MLIIYPIKNIKRKTPLIILLAAAIAAAGYLFYLHTDPVIRIAGPEAEISADEIRYMENIPALNIKGSGYAAGRQHGELLKSQIQEVTDILNNQILQKGTAKGFLLHTYLLKKARQLDGYIPQIYREEMKGVAEGAGVSYNEILIINTYDDLLYLAGCSSIAVTENEKSPLLIHARNLDYPINALAGKNVILHYAQSGVVSVGFPGYIGVLTATNEGGISLSSHTSAASENKMGMPSGILYRKLMEGAKTIADAEAILTDNLRTIGNNLVISSLNENQAAVFEITADKVIKLPVKDYAIATNHFVSEELAPSGKAPSNSQKRYEYLNDFYQDAESINADSIKEVMSFYDGGQAGWSSVANKGTVQSVIFVPAERKIYVAKGAQPPVNLGGYIEYSY